MAGENTPRECERIVSIVCCSEHTVPIQYLPLPLFSFSFSTDFQPHRKLSCTMGENSFGSNRLNSLNFPSTKHLINIISTNHVFGN